MVTFYHLDLKPALLLASGRRSNKEASAKCSVHLQRVGPYGDFRLDVVSTRKGSTSIVETCRRLQIPVREYLSAVLPGLENFPANRVNELTPAAWFSAGVVKITRRSAWDSGLHFCTDWSGRSPRFGRHPTLRGRAEQSPKPPCAATSRSKSGRRWLRLASLHAIFTVRQASRFKHRHYDQTKRSSIPTQNDYVLLHL